MIDERTENPGEIQNPVEPETPENMPGNAPDDLVLLPRGGHNKYFNGGITS